MKGRKRGVREREGEREKGRKKDGQKGLTK